MLLLMPREDLLKTLPVNCNYHTRALLEKYNPTYSLAKYAAELDIPINEVKENLFRKAQQINDFYLVLI